MPDVTLIPAIASFFGVSTDELFDFNVYTIEQNVKAIVDEHSIYWDTDKAKAEQILREGLKKYPGNDVLLNCLIGVIPVPERSSEVIDLCRALIANTHMDDVKYDACRILATCYKETGQNDLIRPTLELIPEIYFTKLKLMASLLDGEDSYEAAQKQKYLSAEDLIDMVIVAGKHLKENGENEKANSQFRIALKIIDAFEDDFIEERWFYGSVYELTEEKRKEIEELLCE